MKNLLSLLLLALSQPLSSGEQEAVFTEIWRSRAWGGESLSGTGSDLVQTTAVRKKLPLLLQKYGCRTLVDAPCGDFYWMQTVDLPLEFYYGADIVRPLIEENQRQFGHSRRLFVHLDLTENLLPQADLIFCRDCLVHFSYKDIAKAIHLFKKSHSTYLLTTSFTYSHQGLNTEIPTGYWRPLDLRKPPFNFPEPLEILSEHCPECKGVWPDKSLFLWRIEDLPDLL